VFKYDSVTSSEKVDKAQRYSEFCLCSIPYPGCEFFRDFKGKGYSADGLYFDWKQVQSLQTRNNERNERERGERMGRRKIGMQIKGRKKCITEKIEVKGRKRKYKMRN